MIAGSFRTHRGVRGVGYFRTHRGVRGLGQDPYQQWLQANPQCLDASGNVICQTPASVIQASATLAIHQPSPLDYASPSVAATAANPTFITANMADAPLTANTPNLSGQLAKAVMTGLATPSTQSGDPTSWLTGVANQYCNLYLNAPGGGDTECGNLNALVAQYAAEYNNAMHAQISAVGGTSAAAGTTSANQQTSLMPARRQSYTSTVVNPSPPSQTVTDGSSLTSPVSVSNVANGATLTTGTTTAGTDIIPGVPNAALFIGAGAVVLILAMGVK